MKENENNAGMLESFLFVETSISVSHYDGGRNVAKCPKCGSDIAVARKSWMMAGRPDKAGKRLQMEIGLFDCPRCKKPFRVVLSKRKI